MADAANRTAVIPAIPLGSGRPVPKFQPADLRTSQAFGMLETARNLRARAHAAREAFDETKADRGRQSVAASHLAQAERMEADLRDHLARCDATIPDWRERCGHPLEFAPGAEAPSTDEPAPTKTRKRAAGPTRVADVQAQDADHD